MIFYGPCFQQVWIWWNAGEAFFVYMVKSIPLQPMALEQQSSETTAKDIPHIQSSAVAARSSMTFHTPTINTEYKSDFRFIKDTP